MISLYTLLTIETAAMLIAWLHFRSLYRHGLVLLIPYLMYTCVVEYLGAYLMHVKHQPNGFLYNPYIIISIAFYGWVVIYTSAFRRPVKLVYYALHFLFCCWGAIWYALYGNPLKIISNFLNLGALLICAFCLSFFYSHLRSRIQHSPITQIPGFWMSSGLLVFYSGISIYTVIYPYLAEQRIMLKGVPLQNLIPQILSLVLYGFIITAIRKCRSAPMT